MLKDALHHFLVLSRAKKKRSQKCQKRDVFLVRSLINRLMGGRGKEAIASSFPALSWLRLCLPLTCFKAILKTWYFFKGLD